MCQRLDNALHAHEVRRTRRRGMGVEGVGSSSAAPMRGALTTHCGAGSSRTAAALWVVPLAAVLKRIRRPLRSRCGRERASPARCPLLLCSAHRDGRRGEITAEPPTPQSSVAVEQGGINLSRACEDSCVLDLQVLRSWGSEGRRMPSLPLPMCFPPYLRSASLLPP